MSTQEIMEKSSILVENVGGIERTSLSFDRGVNILTGRNATNRTSLLQAIMAGLGSNSDQISLRAGADEGRVELELGDETFTRTLTRGSEIGEMTLTGSPYIEDTTESDLFAFLVSENKVRQEIRTGDPNLHEIVMKPLDVDAIEREITELRQEVNELESEIEERRRKEQKIDSLQNRQQSLQADIKDLIDEIETKQAELAERETDLEDSREQQEEFEETLQELRATQDKLAEVENELEDEQEVLESLENEHEELIDELSTLELPDEDEESLKRERRSLNDERDELQNEIDRLNQVISFNRDLLDDQSTGVSEALHTERDRNDHGDLTQQIVDDESSLCWTCGQRVDRSRIQETVEAIKSYKQSKVEQRTSIEANIDEITSKLDRIQSQQAEHRRIEEKKNSVARKIEDAERTIRTLEERRESLYNDTDELEERVEKLETSDVHDELLDLNNTLNELERERQSLERKLKRVESELSDAQSARDERVDLESELEETEKELSEARMRIETIEKNAVDNFNQHMEEVLDTLNYDNIERIWLERRQTEVKQGRRKVEQTVFDINVVRRGNDGTVFQDTLAHLSESEREVVGLIFSLTGYITHEVYEDMPFLLLDSVEAIDADRIAAIVDYLHEYSDFLVVALLPEDTGPTEKLEATQEVITDI